MFISDFSKVMMHEFYYDDIKNIWDQFKTIIY